jgi:hypothetical protein
MNLHSFNLQGTLAAATDVSILLAYEHTRAAPNLLSSLRILLWPQAALSSIPCTIWKALSAMTGFSGLSPSFGTCPSLGADL